MTPSPFKTFNNFNSSLISSILNTFFFFDFFSLGVFSCCCLEASSDKSNELATDPTCDIDREPDDGVLVPDRD